MYSEHLHELCLCSTLIVAHTFTFVYFRVLYINIKLNVIPKYFAKIINIVFPLKRRRNHFLAQVGQYVYYRKYVNLVYNF